MASMEEEGFMSNADWDAAWCERCKDCHLNGVCPKLYPKIQRKKKTS
jgi:TPP-dependent indolepyruvate ferredoxin oxidoreductase alpha subunit